MSKSYRSAMDGIKMSDELKKKIVNASEKGDTGARRRRNKKGKLLRPVYISAASGLAACLALVFVLHHAYITHVDHQPQLEMAQASELPQGDTAEYEAAESVSPEPESTAEVNEKTAVAKAGAEKKNVEKNDNNSALSDKKTAGSNTEAKTDSAAKPTPSAEKSGESEPELRAKAQTDVEDSVPGVGALTEPEAASEPSADTTGGEFAVAKAVEEAAAEPAAESVADVPVKSIRIGSASAGGGYAAAAQEPQPTEEPTEEAAE